MQSDERSKRSLWRYIPLFLEILTPFRVAIGIACLILTLLIIYSMIVNLIDKFINSRCGLKCGYLLDSPPTYFNPMDFILIHLSAHTERLLSIHLFLDTIFFAIMLMYTFICIIYGLIKIGINFFGLELYRIKKRNTMP